MKKYLFVLLFLCIFPYLKSSTIKNPFAFADLEHDQINLNNIARLKLDSKTFAVIKSKNNFDIVRPGERLFGYKIIDIPKDYIIIQDDFNNEAIIILD